MTVSRPTSLFISLAMVASLAACTGSKQPAAAPDADQNQAATGTAPQDAGTAVVTGEVLETANASSYTYVRVATDDGEIWAAAPQFQVAIGDRVQVPLEMPMENFHSDALNRDFDVVYFAGRIAPEGEVPVAVSMPAGHPQVASAEASVTAGAVEPAKGGLTVAQVWQQRADLAGNTVTVRGKVVKFNGGIMGTNWMHLQDGTGDAADGTHDITVTSSTAVKVGDVVTATGTVAVDRDFGAGYKYAVIVENARIATAS